MEQTTLHSLYSKGNAELPQTRQRAGA